MIFSLIFFFFQAEDGIRDLVRSRGLGDVYKRQGLYRHQDRAASARQMNQIAVRELAPREVLRMHLHLSLIHI